MAPFSFSSYLELCCKVSRLLLVFFCVILNKEKSLILQYGASGWLQELLQQEHKQASKVSSDDDIL